MRPRPLWPPENIFPGELGCLRTSPSSHGDQLKHGPKVQLQALSSQDSHLDHGTGNLGISYTPCSPEDCCLA